MWRIALVFVAGLVTVLAVLPAEAASGLPRKRETSPVMQKGKATGERGIASWYRVKRRMVAAHRTLPFGTKVKVVTKNGRSVVVTIIDRGPFVKGRVLDLSSDAFKQLSSLGTGLLTVTVQRIL